MLDSLTHGEALFEILLEGGNPYADGPLTEGETDRLQAAGVDLQALDALVIGRIVKGGRGVWALAGDRLVMLGFRYATSVDAIPRISITSAQRETGRYGETVRLQTTEGRWALYGVHAERAAQLLACLG